MTWNQASKIKPEQGQQVWVSYVFDVPGDEGGETLHQGYAIWSDNDWFFDVDWDGTLLSRIEASKRGMISCTITHWMPLPEAPKYFEV